MEEKKNPPSFPSNYVTLLQLQERWLKERERKQREEEEEKRRQQQLKRQEEEDQKQKQKQKLEDQTQVVTRETESDSKSPIQNHRKQRSFNGREVSVSELDVAGGGDHGADQGGKGEEKKKRKKKVKKKWKRKKLNLTIEDPEEVAGKEGVVQVPLLNGEKEGMDMAARRKGNRNSRGKRDESRAESKNLYPPADIEPKLRAYSVKGKKLNIVGEKVAQSPLPNGEVGDIPATGRTRDETRAESIGFDQTADIEPKFRALTVNGEKLNLTAEKDVSGKLVVVPAPLPNGVKEDTKGRRYRKSSRTKGKTRVESKNLDQTAEFRAKGKKLSLTIEKEVPGEEEAVVQAPLSNSDKQDKPASRGSRVETRAERNSFDQTVNVKSKFRAWSVKGKKLNPTVERKVPGNEIVVRAPLPFGEKEDMPASRGTRDETSAESNDFDQTAEIEPKFRSSSANWGGGDENDGLRRKSSFHSRGCRERKSYGPQWFRRRELLSQKDGRTMWVKKEQVSDGNVC